MKKAGVKVLRNDKQQIEDNLVLKEGKIYVPRDKELRLKIIQLHYNMLIARYREQQKIVELATRNYWQPEDMKKVKRYMEECDQCQRMKNKTEILRKIETEYSTRETIATYQQTL